MKNIAYLFGAAVVLAVVLLVTTICTVVYGFSIYNDEAGLKNQYSMKVKDNESEFDNMWKQISQSSQIADSNKNAFKEIYSSWVNGTAPKTGTGSFMYWVKQAAPPNLKDMSGLYKNVMNIMTGKRDGFTMRQKELIAIAEVYNHNLVVMPRGFFLKLFGFAPIDPQIVTSTRTDNAFKTGKDDDVSLSGQQTAPAPNTSTN